MKERRRKGGERGAGLRMPWILITKRNSGKQDDPEEIRNLKARRRYFKSLLRNSQHPHPQRQRRNAPKKSTPSSDNGGAQPLVNIIHCSPVLLPLLPPPSTTKPCNIITFLGTLERNLAISSQGTFVSSNVRTLLCFTRVAKNVKMIVR